MALVVGILLLIACLGLGYLAFRRVRLMRGGGVDVFLRRRPAAGFRGAQKKDDSAGWHFGVGRYRGNELVWFRLTSFRLGPTAVVDRTQLEIVDRRTPSGGEIYLLPPTASVLRCRLQGVDIEIAMAPGVLTGFLSWLEATPPGRTGYRQAS